MQKMKRICLYAAYAADNRVADYVVHQIRSLAEIAEVHCCFDCDLDLNEINKIRPYVGLIKTGRHKAYDFGSWQKLINEIGWECLSEYDWMIICNDSCYGPFFPLQESLQKAESQYPDFWGMTASREFSRHIQSYFMAFGNPVLHSPVFRNFWKDIKPQKDVSEIIRNYELRLTSLLQEQNFRWLALTENKDGENPTFYPFRLLDKNKIPFIKVKCFTRPDCHLNEVCADWRGFIRTHSVYPPELIEKHCLSRGLDCDKLLNEAMDRISVTGQFYIPGIFSMQITRKLCLKIKLFGFTIRKKVITLAAARQKKYLIDKLNDQLSKLKQGNYVQKT